ncbi:hypothetical protein GCM10011512_01960 [Tersicoccus solisilvae]|uniref:Uncharacterized protein n=1 Tax=Tersicoccus solisilvae TaxID=1882339 RepID=A0ABQ1NJT4_9MICC|nr:hypothetical protein GCM10011512_01960 [Tersicoccus solisilvae]
MPWRASAGGHRGYRTVTFRHTLTILLGGRAGIALIMPWAQFFAGSGRSTERGTAPSSSVGVPDALPPDFDPPDSASTGQP